VIIAADLDVTARPSDEFNDSYTREKPKQIPKIRYASTVSENASLALIMSSLSSVSGIPMKGIEEAKEHK
jgi:hypothetical protein